MPTHRQLEIAEQLFDLDPVASYPERAARAVAELVGASGYRLELGSRLHVSHPKPSGAPSLSIQVGSDRAGSDRDAIGTLHLYGVPLGDEEQRIAGWGARLLTRGIRYAHRLDDNTSQRTIEDVQTMLERTPLTPRERDVVGRLLSGASTRQIAVSTGLTVATVNTYLKRIFAKLGVHSRVELVARITGTRGVIPSAPSAGGSKIPPRLSRDETEVSP